MPKIIYNMSIMVNGKFDPVKRLHHTSWVAVVTATDRPTSVRNSYIIKAFGGVFVFSISFFNFP